MEKVEQLPNAKKNYFLSLNLECYVDSFMNFFKLSVCFLVNEWMKIKRNFFKCAFIPIII